MDFNVFDAIVISVTLILAIKGYFSGIIKEIAGLIGIGSGLFLGSIYYKSVGDYINNSILKIPNESAINVIGFVTVFVLSWLFVILIGMIFSKILKIANLGILDRLGGVVFSAGKFFVIVSVIVMMLSQIDALKSTLSKYQKNSVMWPIMEKVGQTLIHLKPKDIQKQIDDVKQKVKNSVGNNVTEKIKEVKDKIVKTVSKEINNTINESVKKELDKKGE